MISVSNDRLLELIEQSRTSTRRRAAYSPHSQDYQGMQLLVNAIQPDSYIPPHKHPSQEIWIPLKGRINFVIFDENGKLMDVQVLNERNAIFLECPENTYHTGIAAEPDSIFGNLNPGPYSPLDKIPAIWAPSESNSDFPKYLERLKDEIDLFLRR